MDIVKEDISFGPNPYANLIADIQDFAILLLDAEGHIKTWNLGAERLFGFRADEIIGEHFSRLFLEDDIISGVPQQELQHATQKGRASDDRWLVRKDGRRIWVEGCLVALKGSESGGFGKIVRDQTTAKKDKEKIHQLNAELQDTVHTLKKSQDILHEKNKELEQFADAVVGRELKMIQYEKERNSLIADIQSLQAALDSKAIQDKIKLGATLI